MAKTKTTILEALGPWGDPWDKAQAIQWFANEMDKLAGRVGSTQLTAWQCLKTLGLNNEMEFRDLKRFGLDVRRIEGQWCVDVRDFRRWCDRKVMEFKRQPRPATSVRVEPANTAILGRQHEQTCDYRT